MHARYHLDGSGNARHLVTCDCGSSFIASTVSGGAVCDWCKGLVTGRAPDVKVAVEVQGVPAVLCRSCAKASPLARKWLGDTRGAAPRNYQKAG
jgi:hypothetical protein